MQKQIPTLGLRLSPLVATECTLTDRLSGGVRVSGLGKGGVFVCHGWQARSTTCNGPSPSHSCNNWPVVYMSVKAQRGLGARRC
jgi:hypothetical protein